MIKKIIIILNLLILIKSKEFGANLLINSNFSEPSLEQLSQSTPLNFKIFPSIPGWKCTTGCELDSCPLLTPYYATQNVIFGDCNNQVLDMNAEIYGIIYQQFQAEAGSYLLQVQFLLALFQSSKKTFLIFFNGVQIYRFKPIIQNDFFRYGFSSQIITIQGTNNLSFTMDTNINDTSGYRLCQVSVRNIISSNPQEEKIQMISSPVLQNSINIPAIRIVLGQIVNFFVSFDRLQLYYFHNRDYSSNTKEFLKQISNLLVQKGALSQKIIQMLFDSFQNYFQITISRLNYKSKYIGKSFRNQPEQGLGFLQNNAGLVFYSLPFFLILTIIFYCLFRFFFDQRISIIFRKYCFKGIFIIMIFEGNIEQFSFYLFGQILSLFSVQFSHKLVNVFIILFLFCLLLTSTFIYLWFKVIYKQLCSYFVQSTKLSYHGIIMYTLDKGLFCFILGSVHQMGASSPNKQLYMLAAVEACWIISQIIGIWRKLYNNSMIVWVSALQCILRIVFLLFIYGYELGKNDFTLKIFINSQLHFTIIQLFLGVWIISFFISFTQFFLKAIIILCPKRSAKKMVHQSIRKILPARDPPKVINKLNPKYLKIQEYNSKMNSNISKIYYLIIRKLK